MLLLEGCLEGIHIYLDSWGFHYSGNLVHQWGEIWHAGVDLHTKLHHTGARMGREMQNIVNFNVICFNRVT